MSDDQTQQGSAQSGATGVFVPPATRESHGELIDLILRSESMNDEERQYWVDILPVMTTEQIGQLRTILTNEREQLAAIDAKYAQDVAATPKAQRPLEEIGTERRERLTKRTVQEQESENTESQTEEEILKKVQDL
jgi:hypothetical protein